ncbi:MAG: MBL fold metallo-hydrolase [Candidatus Woesebacteria bacterium]|nr:MAG: MBL fold metallo-hydrolase [Candidatus Woesebacteria bacterium]
MNKVKVLVEGYAYPNGDGTYAASPTCTLIESNGKKFLVDPGTNPEKLLKALEKENIGEHDLSFIYISHYHPDHWLNSRLFPNLDIYDGGIRWRNDLEIFHQGKLPEVDVEILKTPGHAIEDTSLLIRTEDGVVCICPDVFWWEDGKQKSDNRDDLLNLEDPFANDKEALLVSRKLVLSKANLIIPGHGKMFKVAT